MDLVDKYPKKSHLLKKLAFAEVYNLDSNNHVTLLFYFKNYGFLIICLPSSVFRFVTKRVKEIFRILNRYIKVTLTVGLSS